MKKYIGILFILLGLVRFSPVSGQWIGTHVQVRNSYLEFQIGQCGCFGAYVLPPAAGMYHPNPGLPTLGMVADVARDGWNVGTPMHCGDYFAAGTPIEGWSVSFDGNSYINSGASCPYFDIPGMVTYWIDTPTSDTTIWQGRINGMNVTHTYILPKDSLFVVANVKLKNDTSFTMNNVYYARNADPDNDNLSGSQLTDNVVVSQPIFPSTDAVVTATGVLYGCYLALASRNPAARVNIGGYNTVNAPLYYAGAAPFRQTVGATSTAVDSAISIGFQLGNIAAGDSVEFSFVYVVDPLSLASALLRTAPACDTITNSMAAVACDSFLWRGSFYTTSGTYKETFTSVTGCDSIEQLVLTINNSATTTLNVDACDSYLFNGSLLTSSGTYTANLSTPAGCDSTVTLNLTINSSATTTLDVDACDSYFFNGSLLTGSGTYTASLSTAAGCDSVVTLDLTIHTLDTSVSVSGGTLTATVAGATYQWLDCDLGFAPVSGATSQSFTPATDGHYAVLITDGFCSDTSGCHEIILASADPASHMQVTISPNPAKDLVQVTVQPAQATVTVSICNLLGEVVQTETFGYATTVKTDVSGLASGMYFITVQGASLSKVSRLMISHQD